MNHKIRDVKLKGLPQKREGPREKKNRKETTFVQLIYTQVM